MTLTVDVKEQLQKDVPELDCILNGANPVYADKRFDDFSE